MKFFAAACAALLAGSVVAVPAQSKTSEAYERSLAKRRSRRTQFQSRPAEFAVDAHTDDSTSADVQYTNTWGGAQQPSSGIVSATGVANCPTASVPPGGSSGTTYGGALWVGIDGGSCHTGNLQTGVMWRVINGQPEYNAWYEWYPAAAVHFSNFTVVPGNQVQMSVAITGATSGTATVTNLNTGQTATHAFSGQPSTVCGNNALWIVEDFGTGGGNHIPFADFSPITFTQASWSTSGGAAGISGAETLDMQQGGVTYTNCGISGSSSVSCSYAG